MWERLTQFGRFARGLSAFFREPLTLDASRERLVQGLESREASFLRSLDLAVFGAPRSPYRALLEWAKLDAEDVSRLVRQNGLEGALQRLHDAGVFIGFRQFKGAEPLKRPGLELDLRADDFNNPYSAREFEARSSGSRGASRRMMLDFESLTQDAAYHGLFLKSFGLTEAPFGIWKPMPSEGLRKALIHGKVGANTERWFSQNDPSWGRGPISHRLLVSYAARQARRAGRPIPLPEYVPIPNAAEVARWLAGAKARGHPAQLDSLASCGVRVCTAARELGLDIEGSFFRLGGEALTPAKVEVIEGVGCRAASHFAASEIGLIGVACGDPEAPDDVHLLEEKLTVIQRPRAVDEGPVVGAYYFTSLSNTPKVLINVEMADYGQLVRRRCHCELGRIGFETHLHTIRSFDKLTSEGILFMGGAILKLVEEVLPRRFGGTVTDYQFVEEEVDGLPRVSIVASPRVGPIDEHELEGVVLDVLGSSRVQRAKTRFWREGKTLRVVRREPYVTGTAKIQPLHLMPASREQRSGGLSARKHG